jgi:predicted nucleotidyltransferase
MAALSKQDLIAALTRLGQLAESQGDRVELVLVGGSLMVLVFEARQTTRDVDVVIMSPVDVSRVRKIAKTIGEENGL